MGVYNGFEFFGDFILEHENEHYPTVLDLTHNPDTNTITVQTGFTAEAPEEFGPLAEEPNDDDVFEGTTGNECVESDEMYLNAYIGYRVAVESDEQPIEQGTTIQWDIEYPDGTLEEAVSTGESM